MTWGKVELLRLKKVCYEFQHHNDCNCYWEFETNKKCHLAEFSLTSEIWKFWKCLMENYLKETNVRLYQKPALPSNASCVEWGKRERQKQREKEKGAQKGLCVCEKDVYFSLPGSQALEDLSLSDNERQSLTQPLLFNVAHMGSYITRINWNNFHHTDPKWHNLPCLWKIWWQYLLTFQSDGH